jgi:U3 small nucleolar RNA-associated protein 10
MSCASGSDASCKESRIDTLSLLALKLDMSSVVTTLRQAFRAVAAQVNVEAVSEYLNVLSQAIEHNSKSTVARNAEEISAFILQILDLRRLSLDGSNSSTNTTDVDLSTIETALQPISIAFIYKLNDTTFRPLFESWVDWALKATDLPSTAPYTETSKSNRLTSLFPLITHIFNTLKSIVTSYATYILEPANSILSSTTTKTITSPNTTNPKDPLPPSFLTLYTTTLTLLLAAMTHDADNFFTAPTHFTPLSTNLLSNLTLPATKTPRLRTVVTTHLIPTIVSLAAATQDTPAHHHAINHALCQLRHHASAAVRLASIRAQLALTQSEEVGEEWINNVVVGAASEGVGGSGETMVYVNEMLEDDSEEVEGEVRRWVQLVRGVVGEDVFEI